MFFFYLGDCSWLGAHAILLYTPYHTLVCCGKCRGQVWSRVFATNKSVIALQGKQTKVWWGFPMGHCEVPYNYAEISWQPRSQCRGFWKIKRKQVETNQIRLHSFYLVNGFVCTSLVETRWVKKNRHQCLINCTVMLSMENFSFKLLARFMVVTVTREGNYSK